MSRKKTKSDELIKLFHYWCGRLKLPKPLEVKKDNRMDCTAAIDNWWDSSTICLKYHSRRVGQLPMCELIGDVFHEIGHVVHNCPYKTEEEIIESEYQAEKFASTMMKNHYPKEYKELLSFMTKKKTMSNLKKKKPIYYKAFSRIKDYKETE